MTHYTMNQWQNFLTMMDRRGFDVDEENEWTKEEFEQRFMIEEGKFIEPFIFCDINGYMVIVFFLPSVNVSQSHIEMFINKMNMEKIDHGLIVYIQSCTYYAESALNMDSSKHYFERFHISFFNFDRMNHKWQPDFQLLPIPESKKLCSKLKVKPTQFPVLKKDNVVCTYWGWQRKRGRLVKIVSYNEDQGEEEISYRVIE